MPARQCPSRVTLVAAKEELRGTCSGHERAFDVFPGQVPGEMSRSSTELQMKENTYVDVNQWKEG